MSTSQRFRRTTIATLAGIGAVAFAPRLQARQRNDHHPATAAWHSGPLAQAPDAGTAAEGTAPGGDTGDDPQAQEIVRRADAIRFPTGGFEVQIRVESQADGQPLEPRIYKVLSRGNESTIVQTVAPPVERGQNMLMRGRELWVYMPSVSQPVRLSLSQRLTGQVANGDLARANFAGDYKARLLRTDSIEGRNYHVLELVAAARGVTYPKVTYWVGAEDSRPFKAEFHAVSGRLLKTCYYEDYAELGGAVRPTQLVMVDAVKEGDRSVLVYSGLEPRELSERMFTKDYMRRLD